MIGVDRKLPQARRPGRAVGLWRVSLFARLGIELGHKICKDGAVGLRRPRGESSQMDPWRCPACGHRHRTPRYVGNYVACDYCDEMFPASSVNQARRAAASSSKKKDDEPEEPSLWVRILLGDPEKAVEG